MTTQKAQPGRTGVTYETVASAAEAMVAAGNKPTWRAVRDNIGATGSSTTILRHLGTWQDGRRSVVVSRVELSSELQRAILQEIAVEVAQARSETNEELASAKDARNELANEGARLEAELDAATAKIIELEAVTATQAGMIEELRTAALASSEREKANSDRSERLERELARAGLLLEQLPRLESDLNALREQLAGEAAMRMAAEQSAAVHETTAAHLRKLEPQLDAARREVTLSATQTADFEKRLGEAEAARRESVARAEAEAKAAMIAEQRLAAAEKRATEAAAALQSLVANQRVTESGTRSTLSLANQKPAS